MFRWLRYPKVYIEFADKSVALSPKRYGVGLDLPIAKRCEIGPLEMGVISTGIRIALTPRYYGFLLPCYKTAYRHNLMVLPLVIDPRCSDVVCVPVFNLSKNIKAVITPNTPPIAQLVIAKRRVFDIVPVPAAREIQKWLGLCEGE